MYLRVSNTNLQRIRIYINQKVGGLQCKDVFHILFLYILKLTTFIILKSLDPENHQSEG